jgi:hypothetical protein
MPLVLAKRYRFLLFKIPQTTLERHREDAG